MIPNNAPIKHHRVDRTSDNQMVNVAEPQPPHSISTRTTPMMLEYGYDKFHRHGSRNWENSPTILL